MSVGAPNLEVLGREAVVERPRRRLEGGGRNREPSGPRARRVWTLLVVVAVAASFVQAGVGRRDVVNAGGWTLVRRFADAALHPELSGEFLRVTWDATLTTLAYAVLGTALAAVLGVAGGLLASEVWWRPRAGGRRRARLGQGGGWMAVRAGLGLPRGIHEAVWGLLLVTILGLDPLVGVLAIGIPYGAVTAKVFSEILDEMPRAPYLALRDGGVGRLRAMAYSLGPQSFPDLVSYLFYRFECSIRGAAILGIIGAGGLGFQLALSFQSLRYEEMWTLLYALIALSGLADWWGGRVRHRLARSSGGRDRFLVGSAVAVVVLAVASAWHLGVDVGTLWAERARRLFSEMVAEALPPDLGAERLAELARASVETLAMSVAAMAVAFVLGTVAAFAATRPRGGGPGRRATAFVTRAGLLVARAIPPPVWALLFLFVLFPGPLPGAMALALYNAGILGRLLAEVVENLDDRPAAALRTQGVGAAAVVLYGVLPRALPRFAAFAVYRWEVTIRETVVVGLVGAGGLGRLLVEELARFDYSAATGTIAALVVLTVAADLVGAQLRRALR